MGKKVLGVLGTYSFLHIFILYGVNLLFIYPYTPGQNILGRRDGTIVPPHLDGCFHIPAWYGRNLLRKGIWKMGLSL